MLHKISGVIVNNLIKIRLSSASYLVVGSDLSQIALPDDFHDVNTLYTCSSRYICVKLLWV